MRWTRTLGLIAALSPCTLGGQSFEGAITIRITVGGRGGAPATEEVEYVSRGGNMRVNVMSPVGAVAILGLAAEGKTYIVIESQRAYMEVRADDAASATASNAGAPTITRSGRKDTVAGFECEHVIVETSGANGPQKTDMCLTRSLGPYVNPMAGFGGGRATSWQRQLALEGGFPLKVSLPDGTVALEVTKIVRRRVSDALFRIPPEFSKVDMPKRP